METLDLVSLQRGVPRAWKEVFVLLKLFGNYLVGPQLLTIPNSSQPLRWQNLGTTALLWALGPHSPDAGAGLPYGSSVGQC